MARTSLAPTRKYSVVEPSAENLKKTEWNIKWVVPILKFLIRPKVELTWEGSLPPTGPVLVLSNHIHFLDPFAIIIAAKRPIHFLAAESLWHNRFLSFFTNLTAGIPKKKFVADLQSVRTLRAWRNLGGAVGLFPEGERSWDGRSLPMVDGIERLVRIIDAPIVCCRVHNGYRHGPRWAENMRTGRIHIEFDPPKHFEKNTELSEIRAWLEERLRVDPHNHKSFPVTGNKRAIGLANYLFACPNCQKIDTLREHNNTITCSTCQQSWDIDYDSNLPPKNGPAFPLTQPIDAIKARIARDEIPDQYHPNILTSQPMTMLRVEDTLIEVAAGILSLTPEGLFIHQNNQLVWSLQHTDILMVAIDLRRKLQIRTRDQQTFEAVFPTESVVKWSWYIEHWRQKVKATP